MEFNYLLRCMKCGHVFTMSMKTHDLMMDRVKTPEGPEPLLLPILDRLVRCCDIPKLAWCRDVTEITFTEVEGFLKLLKALSDIKNQIP